jgi:hypothetical protein
MPRRRDEHTLFGAVARSHCAKLARLVHLVPRLGVPRVDELRAVAEPEVRSDRAPVGVVKHVIGTVGAARAHGLMQQVQHMPKPLNGRR